MDICEGTSQSTGSQKRYRGIRRRKWGKWVSEIRVPGTQDRLWLGSYSTPEAAAVAYDVAYYCLRGPSSLEKLNFPLAVPPTVQSGASPRTVQKAASDAGMAMDAQFIMKATGGRELGCERVSGADEERNLGFQQAESLTISVEDYL